jgi:hypothetical protein
MPPKEGLCNRGFQHYKIGVTQTGLCGVSHTEGAGLSHTV